MSLPQLHIYAKICKKYAKYVSMKFICIICTPHFPDVIAGASYICPFLLERPGSPKLGWPICDKSPGPTKQSKLNVMVGPGQAWQATGITAGAAGSDEAGAAATGVLDDCERAPPGGSA